MRALPKPRLAPGPLADLFDALHDLHHQAGWPSLRTLAAEVGCSHTTISATFSNPRPARWGLLELVVEALGGDIERFHSLWLAATGAGTPVTAAPVTAAAVVTTGPVTSGPAPALPENRYRIPRDLPAAVVPLVGRSAQLSQLDQALAAAGAGTGPNVVLICGPAGVGKTSLAVTWSHTVADRHPDGQLCLDLRGYDVSRARTPSAAADAVLRRLGVEAAAVPPELSERAALLRSHLIGRRLLLLLDNAHSADQVWPLIPGSSSAFVVVTSRDTLPGLIARAGARRIVVDRLTEEAAADLLTGLIGGPARAEPDAVRALAARCAHLPLALQVAAEIVTRDRNRSLSEQVARFDRRPARLDLLDAGGDGRTAVRSVFSWSRRRLSRPAGTLFELLGLSPARELEPAAAAALLGAGPEAGATALDELARAHLIEPHVDTFGLHDLLRDYVVELAARRPEAERRAARRRLFEHYLRAGREAVAAGPPDGTEWLRRHRATLVAVARSAAHDSPAHGLELAALIHPYLEDSGHYLEAIALQRRVIEVARRTGDAGRLAAALCRSAGVLRRSGAPAESLAAATEALQISEARSDRAGMADALQAMATVHIRQGRNEQGSEQLSRAVAIYRELGDRAGEAAAANRWGIALMQLGRLTEALAQHTRAHEVYQQLGIPLAMGRTANNVGVLQVRLGHYPAAHESLSRALAGARATGNRAGVGVALANLGDVAERRHRFTEAVADYRQAIEVCEEVGYLAGLADARRGLGRALGRLGAHDEGLAWLREALALGRRIGDADVETATLNDLGLVQRLAGRDGSDHHRAARAGATRTGDRYQQARALDGLAAAARAAGEVEQARQWWREALELFADLGVPEAGDVRGELSRLGQAVAAATQSGQADTTAAAPSRPPSGAETA
jgi:tetratricopeptide (TPR) repeat protein